MADLGVDATVLTGPGLDSVRVPRMFANATRAVTLTRANGVDPVLDSTATMTVWTGDTVSQYWGDFENPVVDSLRIGSSVHEHVLIAVEIAAGPMRPFDGILGRELLSRYDLEVNLPRRVLRLYERYTPIAVGERPRWVPAGIRADGCVRVPLTHDAMPDVIGFGDADRRLAQTDPVRRMLESQNFAWPLVINGTRVTGFLDMGADELTVNTVAAQVLHLRTAARAAGTVKGHGEAMPVVSDVAVQFAGQPLRTGAIVVSDSMFAKFPDVATRPLVALGLQHFLDRPVFLSFSTGMICLGSPQG